MSSQRTTSTTGLPVGSYLQLHREQLQKSLAETEVALGSLATQESIPTGQESPALPPETQ